MIIILNITCNGIRINQSIKSNIDYPTVFNCHHTLPCFQISEAMIVTVPYIQLHRSAERAITS